MTRAEAIELRAALDAYYSDCEGCCQDDLPSPDGVCDAVEKMVDGVIGERIACPECRGSGFFWSVPAGYKACQRCNGAGFKAVSEGGAG